MNPEFKAAAAQVHLEHAITFGMLRTFFPADVCVSIIVRSCVQYAMIELQEGFSPDDAELFQCGVLGTSDLIAEHGLTDFAISEFQAGFAERLAGLGQSGGRA